MPRQGWRWFGAWTFPGVVLGLQASSLGIILLPAGLLAVALLISRVRGWPEPAGALAGVGAVALLFASLNQDYRPCPTDAQGTTIISGADLQPGGQRTVEFSCGGIDPVAALAVGLTLIALRTLAYTLARRAAPAA